MRPSLQQTQIFVYSHFFEIINPSYLIQKLIYEYVKPLVIFDRDYTQNGPQGKPVFVPTKVFSSRTEDRKEYRLHVNQLSDFLNYLEQNRVSPAAIPLTRVPMYTPAPMTGAMTLKYPPRDYQIPAIEAAVHPVAGQHTSLIGLPTGTGKTFCGLSAVKQIGTRTLLILLPNYIDKWTDDIGFNLGADPKTIMVVQGAAHLTGLISLALDNTLEADFIIVSTVTYRMYIEAYDASSKDCLDQYGVYPKDLCKVLGVGTVLIDETHQHVHAIFKIMLTLHVPHLISLTATLLTDHHVVKRAHDIMYPKETRYDKLLFKKYIHTVAVNFTFRHFDQRRIKVTQFNNPNYSHVVFEKSLLKDKENLIPYLTMLDFFFTNLYLKEKAQEDRAIIFVSTRDMADAVVKFLNKLHPDLDINRFMQGDSYDVIQKSQIVVSTIGSAGTGHDMANLTRVFMMVNVASPVANAQTLGRLREIPNKEVKFIYFFSTNIQKQLVNHQKRKEILFERSATFKELTYSPYL